MEGSGAPGIFQADRSNNSTSFALQATLVSHWEQQDLISPSFFMALEF